LFRQRPRLSGFRIRLMRRTGIPGLSVTDRLLGACGGLLRDRGFMPGQGIRLPGVIGFSLTADFRRFYFALAGSFLNGSGLGSGPFFRRSFNFFPVRL
jgi:hypothetical protein